MAIRWGGSFNMVVGASDEPLSGYMFGTIDAPPAAPRVSADPELVATWLQKQIGRLVEVAVAELQAPLSSEQLEPLSKKLTELARPYLDDAGATGPVIVEGIKLHDGPTITRPAPAPAVSAPAAPPAPVGLTVEQYASLCVERMMYPQAGQSVAQRYGVPTPEALHALDAQWQHRFGAEPGLHQRWQLAYQQYEAWLRQQR